MDALIMGIAITGATITVTISLTTLVLMAVYHIQRRRRINAMLEKTTILREKLEAEEGVGRA